MEPTAATKLTIYIGDSGKHGHKPLHLAIVELLHEESTQRATVVHAIEGYGVHKQIYTARILDLSGDVPIVITAVDLPEKIDAVIPKLDEMIGEDLVTTEEVRIVISRPSPSHDLRCRQGLPALARGKECRASSVLPEEERCPSESNLVWW